MKNKEPNLLIIGLISIIAATTFLIYSQMSEKEPEKVMFSAITERSGETVTASAVNVSTVTQKEAKSTTTLNSASAAAATTEPSTEFLYVNLNTADKEQLVKLDGIGEVKAAAIIEYRTANGGFHNIEELMNVSGIGEDTFSAIEEHIYVDDPTYPETTAEPVSTVTTTKTEPTSAVVTVHKPTLEELAPININEADKEELMLLPYVNEEVAEAIIKLRTDLKGFGHIYELLYIDKLTQKQVAEIAGFVTVGQ